MGRETNQNDEMLISALLQCPTTRAAAEMCGVSESKIYSRLRTPAFKKKYDQARRELLERGCAALQGLMGDAIDAMAEIVRDKETSQQVRLNAAEMILRNGMKVTEQMDILSRLDALEKASK